MVYCEWPLAQDLEHVRDLAQLAREKQVRTMVAVQGRVAPSVKKLRELLEHGRIGKVVSAEVRAAGGLNDREILPKNLEYFTKREVGGNVFTIGFGHLWDQIQFVHGDASALQSRLHLQFPNSKIRDPETNIVKTVQSDVPDLIIVTSSLEESAIAQKEATLLVRFRRGQPSFDEPALLWSIIGEKGEIRLTNSGGTGMQATGDTASVRLVVQDFATNKVEQIEWQWEAWQEDLPLYARSVGALYEAFSEGAEKSYPTFEDALKRHEQLDGMLAAWAA